MSIYKKKQLQYVDSGSMMCVAFASMKPLQLVLATSMKNLQFSACSFLFFSFLFFFSFFLSLSVLYCFET